MLKLEPLSYKEQNKIIDQALREHYRESWERKRVPSDYLVMFTEGGESNAVADAIAKAQLAKDQKTIERSTKAPLPDPRLLQIVRKYGAVEK
jgi:hypothetical protein